MTSSGPTATSEREAAAPGALPGDPGSGATTRRAVGTEVPLLAGWAAIGTAGALGNGTYSSESIVLVTVGTLLLVLCAVSRSAPARQWSRLSTVLAGAAVFLGFHDATAIYGSGPALQVSRVLTVVTTVVVGVWLMLGLRRRQLVTYGAIVVMVGAGVAMVISSPRPVIDVWFMLQNATRGLSHGQNIYTIRWTTGAVFEQSNGFAYLPGAAVLVWPFHAVFGDVRYGLLAAMAATAVIFARVRAGSPLVLLGALVMLYPKTMFGLEQSWVDPLVLAALCAAAYAVVRGRPGWAVVALAVCLVCKQQAWLVLPLAFFWKDFGWRRAALSAAGACVFILPWAAAAPHAFYSGVITYNLDLPPRYDSLSLFSAALRHGWRPGFAIVFVVTVLAIVLVLWRLPGDTYGFLLGSAVVMAVFNLANKQSFFNEWALAAGLALAALVFAPAPGVDRSPGDGGVSPAAQVGLVRS